MAETVKEENSLIIVLGNSALEAANPGEDSYLKNYRSTITLSNQQDTVTGSQFTAAELNNIFSPMFGASYLVHQNNDLEVTVMNTIVSAYYKEVTTVLTDVIGGVETAQSMEQRKLEANEKELEEGEQR